ncbi:hypothetical protein CDD83_7879 [Cordyceps sp. RAO-2017]|nr:hypothetical protein CDD83_7879 [Cordyceps sp. RAO-2017]
MRHQLSWTLASALLAAAAAQANGQQASPKCRCVPGESCWPSEDKWLSFGAKLKGKLVKSEPVAISCYEGPLKDLAKCNEVWNQWSADSFQTKQPLGRYYPYTQSCPPVDYAQGEAPKTCSLGQLPVYVVEAVDRSDIAEALRFTREHNIRVTVTNTGHDLNGRSDGFGSLTIWLQKFRKGISFQPRLQSATGCAASNWSGSALRLDGAYRWRDVVKVAKEKKVMVVSGGSGSPGASGGWMLGGGHGPASREYGLGADQLLEAEVMLANGSVVTANHCQHPDLFRSLRGGGPGYGVVLGVTIKAYLMPDTWSMTVHQLDLWPETQTDSNSELLDAVAHLAQSFPQLNDAGFSGYGVWFRNLRGEFMGGRRSGYNHKLWIVGKNKTEAWSLFEPVRASLDTLKGAVVLNETLREYRNFWTFFDTELGHDDVSGLSLYTTSRFLDKPAVADLRKLREAVDVVSGRPEEYTMNILALGSGGKVFEDAADTSSGLHPAWRTAPMFLITGRRAAHSATEAERRAVMDDITRVKGAATKSLAPDTGAYMNEGDRNDPDWKQAFYGSNYGHHLATKHAYDPDKVFYCPTCVGSDEFVSREDGALCLA